ncbi:DUF2878 domain-containing protein [Frateuria soli]|uniref:DUF2878 domain-containing protein n=1 Tax=Frateuria soli TaxID=1542730 RepID=UPI001E3D46D4|nr:DUF2878 domain-containing protein [Frateuria soli]UGB38456.1 DUF2878 domain-containing protein [Frateuria soli]
MNAWVTLAAYELAWLAAVAGAGRGHAWPGLLAVALFAAWRLATSRTRLVDLRLAAVALALGLALEATWTGAGLLRYAAPWPVATAPAWLLALWVAFALTIVPLFGYLHARPWLAAMLGAIGGPLAYLGAARGWRALAIAAPAWHPLLALALGWAVATPVLTSLARYWLLHPPKQVRA